MAIAYAITYLFGTIADIEKMYESLTIERVVRDGLIIERDEGFTLEAGDIVGVYALREAVGPLSQWEGPEIDHPESLSFPTREVDIVLTSPEFAGKTIHQVKSRLENTRHLGCFINTITRQGYELPLLPSTVLRRGDVLRLTGRTASVEALAKRWGGFVKTASKAILPCIHWGW